MSTQPTQTGTSLPGSGASPPGSGDGNDVQTMALLRAAGLARSAQALPGESFVGAFDKSAVEAVVAFLRRDGFIVRVGPHRTNPTDLSTVAVTWPKDRAEAASTAGETR